MEPPAPPSFREALRFWFRLGCISFGGPAGQIAIMHEEAVNRRKWVGEEAFLRALNFCTLLPGPEAQQLATWLGWRLHGVRGGIAAGALFVLPAALLLLALSWLAMSGGDTAVVRGIFNGLKPAVVAILFGAMLRIGKKALRTRQLTVIGAAAFTGIVSGVPFPLVLSAAAAAAAMLGSRQPSWIGQGAAGQEPPASAAPGSVRRGLKWAGICAVLWWAPVFLTIFWLGIDSLHAGLALFFSKAAVITFGGAYAILPYVADQAVNQHHWITLPQVMDGLALAETTPGPLIIVLQHFGFAAGWAHPPAGWSREGSALLAAGLTTWVTFLPSFLWILGMAPFAERLQSRPVVQYALAGVTAAVAGVILHLALLFAGKVFFPSAPTGWQPDGFAILLAAACFAVLRWTKAGTPVVILAAAAAGAARALLF